MNFDFWNEKEEHRKNESAWKTMEKLPNKSSPRVEQKGVNQKFYIHTGNRINDGSDSYYNRVETTATENTTQMTMTIKQDGNDDGKQGLQQRR